MIDIDPVSLCSLPIELFRNEIRLGHATGICEHDGEDWFLITNWHVVTGINPITDKSIDSNCATPNLLRAWFPDSDFSLPRFPVDIPLIDRNGRPNWKEHPEHGRLVDVVYIPFEPTDDIVAMRLSDLKGFTYDLPERIGEDVFVLGYPFPPKKTGNMPVWKRGSIATEVSMNIAGLPKFFVDTATRPGMSGAPVVRRAWDIQPSQNGTMNVDPGSVSTSFIGIYSGRIGTLDDGAAQLGIVWNVKAVRRIFSSGVPGAYPWE